MARRFPFISSFRNMTTRHFCPLLSSQEKIVNIFITPLFLTRTASNLCLIQNIINTMLTVELRTVFVDGDLDDPTRSFLQCIHDPLKQVHSRQDCVIWRVCIDFPKGSVPPFRNVCIFICNRYNHNFILKSFFFWSLRYTWSYNNIIEVSDFRLNFKRKNAESLWDSVSNEFVH